MGGVSKQKSKDRRWKPLGLLFLGLLALLALGGCGFLDVFVDLEEHDYFPNAEDVAEYYQLNFDLEQGIEESYHIDLLGDYLLEYAYTSDPQLPDSLDYLHYMFLLERGRSPQSAQQYMDETIDAIYQRYIDPVWEERPLYKIDLGQDEYYGREFFYQGEVQVSFVCLRIQSMSLSFFVNANEEMLPGFYSDFIGPYVREMKRRFVDRESNGD